jgi:hypothetical protein
LARLVLYVDGVRLGEVRAGAAAIWRYDFAEPLDGAREIRLVEIDEAGRPLTISAQPVLPIQMELPAGR